MVNKQIFFTLFLVTDLFILSVYASQSESSGFIPRPPQEQPLARGDSPLRHSRQYSGSSSIAYLQPDNRNFGITQRPQIATKKQHRRIVSAGQQPLSAPIQFKSPHEVVNENEGQHTPNSAPLAYDNGRNSSIPLAQPNVSPLRRFTTSPVRELGEHKESSSGSGSSAKKASRISVVVQSPSSAPPAPQTAQQSPAANQLLNDFATAYQFVTNHTKLCGTIVLIIFGAGLATGRSI